MYAKITIFCDRIKQIFRNSFQAETFILPFLHFWPNRASQVCAFSILLNFRVLQTFRNLLHVIVCCEYSTI